MDYLQSLFYRFALIPEEHLRHQGPQTPKALSDALGIPRRSVARLLKDLVQAGAIERQGGPFDPSAVYQIKKTTG